MTDATPAPRRVVRAADSDETTDCDGASEGDVRAVAAQLGRPPAGTFRVAARGASGLPSVIANDPFLRDGTPMPTRFWLVDPALCEQVSRLEADGGVRMAQAAVDPVALARAHERYAGDRDALVPVEHDGPRPAGGVGGTRRGVKCLHAHLAWWLAGGEDPVGAWVADKLELSRDSVHEAR